MCLRNNKHSEKSYFLLNGNPPFERKARVVAKRDGQEAGFQDGGYIVLKILKMQNN